eukprot:2270487-Pleurochrysis_carterae.AAC.2
MYHDRFQNTSQQKILMVPTVTYSFNKFIPGSIFFLRGRAHRTSRYGFSTGQSPPGHLSLPGRGKMAVLQGC